MKESRVLVRFDAGCEDAVFLSALEVASRASGTAVVGGFRVGREELIAVGDDVIGLVPSRSTSDRPPVRRVPLPLGRADSLAAREGPTGARIRRTTKAMETKAPLAKIGVATSDRQCLGSAKKSFRFAAGPFVHICESHDQAPA